MSRQQSPTLQEHPVTHGAFHKEISQSGAPAPANINHTDDKIILNLNVNGQDYALSLDPRVTLLDALREHLHLTGTKKGCDHGQCGACTVLINGTRINSCLSFAVMHEGSEITTIEGLGAGDLLHPMQAAFLEHDAFQCGYCTPGQIVSATALLSEPMEASEQAIRENMSGNLCRCGAYPNIVAAVRQVLMNGARKPL
jgi:xanthine dehydrogenase YagT iron-sulfur-binding subunit